MHHVQLEQFAQGQSYLHGLDARAKLGALAVFLGCLGTLHTAQLAPLLGFGTLLLVCALLSRLPFSFLLLRSAVVLPFSVTFAAISWLSGDTERAVSLAAKSYLSAIAVLLVMGTTPMPALLRGMESLHVPKLLLIIVQFLYRYLFVVVDQAARMRLAARCRDGGKVVNRQSLFRRAAGALSVLFAKSYARAEGIHQAMLARGFDGQQQSVLRQKEFTPRDRVFLIIAAVVSLAVRIGYAGISNH